MNVESLMTKSVRVCRPEDTLDTAARAMWDYDCGSIPVLDGEGKVVGILTDRDICMSAWSHARLLKEISVAAAMSSRVFVCKPNDRVDVAEDVMRTNQVRRLPVVDDAGRLVGLLSLADIAREARREMLQRVRDIEGIEVAATLAAVCRSRATPESEENTPSLVPATKPEPKVATTTKPTARVQVKLS
jgi:CBS domain-containing protein